MMRHTQSLTQQRVSNDMYKHLLLLLLIPAVSWGHSMSPSFETDWSLTPTHNKTYTLTNNYDYPAVYGIEVLNRDGSIAEDWESERELYKLLPDSKVKVYMRFKSKGQRKILVCSVLKEIGKQNEKASIISRVCSRLIINGVRKQL